MSNMTETCVIQVTNVAPSASKEQLKTLFSFLGKVRDIQLFPPENTIGTVIVRVAYVQFEDPTTTGVALHLCNTVFVDRALMIVPVLDGKIPDERSAAQLTPQAVAGMLPGQPTWPANVVSQVVGTGPNQIITTYDPRLTSLGLPQYPPLPATTEPSKIEEIRRTVYASNLDPKVTGEMLLGLFSQAGEVKYVRMAGEEAGSNRGAYIEFSDQRSVAQALAYNNYFYHERNIKVAHAVAAIQKPENTNGSNEASAREIEEAMKKVKEASKLISAAAEKEPSSSPSRKRSRSKSKGRSRSPSRNRRTRSRSKGRRRKSRSRSKPRRSRSRKRSPRRSRTPRRRRSRSRGRGPVVPPPVRRSRSRDRRRSRTRSPIRRRRSRSTSRIRKRSRTPPRSYSRRSTSRPRKRSVSRTRRRSRSRDRKEKSKKRVSRSPSPVAPTLVKESSPDKASSPPKESRSPSPEKPVRRSPTPKRSKSPARRKRRRRTRSPSPRRRSRSGSGSRVKSKKDRRRSRSREKKRSRSRDRKHEKRSRQKEEKKKEQASHVVKRDYDEEEKGYASNEEKEGPVSESRSESPSLPPPVLEKEGENHQTVDMDMSD